MSTINDGLTELQFEPKNRPARQILQDWEKSQKGGLNFYDYSETNELGYCRGKRIKMTFRGIKGETEIHG